MAHLRITNELKSHPEGVIVRCGEKGHSFVVVDSSYDIRIFYNKLIITCHECSPLMTELLYRSGLLSI